MAEEYREIPTTEEETVFEDDTLKIQTEENEQKENPDNKEDKAFHPDVTSNEDRKKIMEGYKKSLRNRVFAPLVGGGASINPIDIINEESGEDEELSLDIYDIMDQRLTEMEKKAENALLMARVSTAIGIMAAALAIMAATIK